ncbi:MAG: DUF63 family protein [Candidatus Hydrothermarchaeales archaeon]
MVSEFLYKYFIKPIYTGEGYNIYNTLVYAALLLLGLYGVERFLERLEVKIDARLFRALVPFLVLGGELRGIESYYRATGQGVHAYLVTPGLYIMLTTIAAACLWLSRRMAGKEYDRPLFRMGSALAALGLVLVLSKVAEVLSGGARNIFMGQPLALNAEVFALVWVFAVILSGIILLGTKRIKGLYTAENALIIFGIMLMASSATLGATLLGYRGEQMLTEAMLSSSPYLYLIFNVALVLVVLYSLEDDRETNWYWLGKFAILVLGLPHGIHNSIAILMGV